MRLMGFMLACILINNAEMSAAWYFLAGIVVLIDLWIDVILGQAVAMEGVKKAAKFFTSAGHLTTIDGGKSDDR